MGLDNGVTVKMKPGFVVPEGKYEWKYQYTDTDCYEIIYWRKWWGVRNDVVYSVFNLGDDGITKLDKNKIETIISILESWDDEDKWNNDEGSSIWDYDDNIHEQIQGDIAALKWLIEFMNTHADEIEIVYFYDSY